MAVLSIAPGLAAPTLAAPEKILVLYKERDPDHEGIVKMFSGLLKRANYVYEARDVEAVLAENPDMSAYSGIMTLFQSSQMIGSGRYPHWLAEQMEDGRRVLIVGNYGAYQGLIPKPDGGLLEFNQSTQNINTFFFPFGLQFHFAFTNDTSVLRLVTTDTQYAQFEVPVTQSQLTYYPLQERQSTFLRRTASCSKSSAPTSQTRAARSTSSHPSAG